MVAFFVKNQLPIKLLLQKRSADGGIDGRLDGKQRAEHPDYLPDLNFKKAKTEASGEQKKLL